jgi:HK97 family phage prohead protease
MSETEGQVIHREFTAELSPSGDGRTLEVRILPYKTVARVSDKPGEFYDEEWLPGAFDNQLNAANRVDVLANFEHQQGISGVIARGTALRDSDEALEGTFRMLNHPDADKALELVNERVLTGISVEAVPLKTKSENGVVQRVKARLVNIALCRSPAFKDAQVLAVREQPPEEPAPEEPTPPPDDAARNPEVDDLLKRMGYQPIGELNVNELPGAVRRLSQIPAEHRPAEARKLVRLYRAAGMELPSALWALATK